METKPKDEKSSTTHQTGHELTGLISDSSPARRADNQSLDVDEITFFHFCVFGKCLFVEPRALTTHQNKAWVHLEELYLVEGIVGANL